MEVGIRELRDGLSRYLAKVRAGAEIVVTDRGKPIARIVPQGERAIDRLIAEGLVTPAQVPKDDWLPDPIPTRGSVSGLVTEMRQEREDRILGIDG